MEETKNIQERLFSRKELIAAMQLYNKAFLADENNEKFIPITDDEDCAKEQVTYLLSLVV